MTDQSATRAELAEAVEAVSATFSRLPVAVQQRIDVARDGLEAEVDAAIVTGDRGRAQAAIRVWRGHWLTTIEKAGR